MNLTVKISLQCVQGGGGSKSSKFCVRALWTLPYQLAPLQWCRSGLLAPSYSPILLLSDTFDNVLIAAVPGIGDRSTD